MAGFLSQHSARSLSYLCIIYLISSVLYFMYSYTEMFFPIHCKIHCMKTNNISVSFK